ncbi:DUF2235 domain-containing protein [Sulfitobacter sp. S190]|uniref:DUF2235 domain-containing protein n=1 Tax=Sulfitobacter sp. S190 TaxID=2867022 RepID=UPI0021A4548F|nr:DUF2235 domain-containing protein [Sulfitobacter sp. S190]UWR21329.1 DUF2235 domain-containing protein [Sulfitobacter sp. S190]
MGRIAIFCDGTWNSPTIAQPTHVVSLFDHTAITAEQRTVYITGVGTRARNAGFLAGLADRIGGGAFGWGLNDNIKQAYHSLCLLYRPGDDIMIFGFSRGAYTARSLAGMIRKCGILKSPTPENVDAAFDLYRLAGPENHPDALQIIKARRALSPHYATSQDDVNHRLVNPIDDDPDEHRIVRISYLGIWDTVGALGIPAPILGPIAGLWNGKYRFHDTKLSRIVSAARHAVALDERRVFYRPSLWDNLEASRDDPGRNAGDRSENRKFKQVWFTGTHAIVGGSDAARGLAGESLAWIAEGAQQAGLEMRAGNMLDAPLDPLVNSLSLSQPPWLYQVAGHLLKWRDGPGHDIDLHASAKARVEGRRDYRPRSLQNLMPHLFDA